MAAESGLRLLDFDAPESGLTAYAIDGARITQDDARPIWERIDAARTTGRKMRIYCELNAIPPTSMGVVADKLKRLAAIWQVVERMAIVGDQGWLKGYETIIDPITRIDIRTFHTSETDAARSWITAPLA